MGHEIYCLAKWTVIINRHHHVISPSVLTSFSGPHADFWTPRRVSSGVIREFPRNVHVLVHVVLARRTAFCMSILDNSSSNYDTIHSTSTGIGFAKYSKISSTGFYFLLRYFVEAQVVFCPRMKTDVLTDGFGGTRLVCIWSIIW